MKKRMLAFTLFLSLFLVPFITGCASTKPFVNELCQMYDLRAQSLVRPEYLAENPVIGIDGYWQNTHPDIPKSRTVIIRDEETLNTVFTSFPHEVNFEAEAVLLYMISFTTVRECYIKSVALENNSLSVLWTEQKKLFTTYDTVTPYQRCFYLIVNATDFDTAEFTYVEFTTD